MDAAGYSSEWAIAGQVQEKRELTSAKSPNWRGYVLKVATLGNAFEVSLSKELYDQVEDGAFRLFGGVLDNVNGRLRLTCKKLGVLKREKSPAAEAAA